MFRFEHIEYLNYLWVIPIMAIIYILTLRWNKSRLSKFGDETLVQKLIPGISTLRNHIKFILFLVAMAFLFVGWANPQWGLKKAKAKAKSTDVYIALDISQSMLAEDISPNRLERAKRFTIDLLKKLKSERVGLIFFAGNAYLQVPVTHDMASVELFVKAANTEKAATQGTAIAEAISLTTESLERAEEKTYKKALIIITDGENHEQEVIDAAKTAQENGVIVYAVGVGTEAGDYVRVIENGYKQYKKDKNGNPVRTSLNTQLIKDIADAGGGLSFLLSNANSVISGITNDISKLEKKESEVNSFSEYNSYFQYFLFIALIFLVIEYLISQKQSENSFWNRLNKE